MHDDTEALIRVFVSYTVARGRLSAGSRNFDYEQNYLKVNELAVVFMFD